MKTWATIGRALRDEQSCAMVSIVDAKGSAPREPGARMVVLEDGSFAGTIGGGTLEWQAIERARAALAKGAARGGRSSGGSVANGARPRSRPVLRRLGAHPSGSVHARPSR